MTAPAGRPDPATQRRFLDDCIAAETRAYRKLGRLFRFVACLVAFSGVYCYAYGFATFWGAIHGALFALNGANYVAIWGMLYRRRHVLAMLTAARDNVPANQDRDE